MLNNKRLRQIRKDAGLTQADVAAKLNIKRESYTRYETGDIQPPSDQVVRLAGLFGTTSDYLFGLSDCPFPPDRNGGDFQMELPYMIDVDDLSEEDRKDLNEYVDLLRLRAKSRAAAGASPAVYAN